MGDNLPAIPERTLLIEGMDGQYAGVVNPITGEVAPFSDVGALADWLVAIKDHQSHISAAKRIVDELLLADMDRNAMWTMNRHSGRKVTAPRPSPGIAADQWDGNRLYQALEGLVSDEVISAQALAAAVEIRTEYVAKAAGVKALLAIPDVAPYVEACRAEEPPAKKRSVSVK